MAHQSAFGFIRPLLWYPDLILVSTSSSRIVFVRFLGETFLEFRQVLLHTVYKQSGEGPPKLLFRCLYTNLKVDQTQ